MAEVFGDFHLALVLSGGNALGSYQAGAYEAIQEHGLEPDHIAGASAGAINGAIIAGNPAAARLSRLRALWNPASDATTPASQALETARRTQAAIWTMIAGNPAIFVPRRLFGPLWNPFGNSEPSSLYDTTPLRETLERLIDFDLLNQQAPRFSAMAVDLGTGEDIAFDTRELRVHVDHLRASAALLPAFPPVRIGERLLGDAGISANLPLDKVLSDLPERPLLCIAVDLLPLQAPLPSSLGEATIRMQDLIFATQSRRAIAAWQAIFDERARNGASSSVTLLHVAYADHSREVSGKAFDFSPSSAAARWRAGYADTTAALESLASNLTPGRPGLTTYALNAESRTLREVRWPLEPISG